MRYASKSQAFILAVSILIGLLTYAIHSGGHNSGLNQPAGLQGEAACECPIQDHPYDSLQAAVSAARYRIYEDEKTRNGFYANNSTQQLAAHFTADAARLSVKHNANADVLATKAIVQAKQQAPVETEPSQLRLSFIGAGYGDVIHQPQGEPAITTAENRLTYIHRLTSNLDSASGWLSVFAKSATQSAIEEWYVNKPEGIEHGFTFSEPVCERVGGELLRVELEFDGDFIAQAVEDGKAIVFKSEDGKAHVSYAGLKVYDADGLELKATMTVKGAVLSFEVDDTNAVYPITIDPTFTQQQKLVPGATASDSFGTDVAITGDTAVVGAPFDDVGANVDQGSIFVFVRSGTTWSQQARLFATDGAANDSFGFSVAISANTIVVGAPEDDGIAGGQGSAYVFLRTGATWSQQAKLTASDAAQFDFLGNDVAIEGDYAAIAAVGDNNGSFEGTVRIFHRAGTTWTNESTVVGDPGHRQASDLFATSVALSGSTLVVGAPDGFLSVVEVEIESFYKVGKVHVLVRSGTTWNPQQVILGDYQPVTFGSKADGLGRSVAINTNTLAAGSWRANTGSGGGNLKIWFRSGATWTLQFNTYGGPAEAIASGVAIDGDTAVYTSLAGVRVLIRTGTTWALQATLTSVGESLSLSGGTLLTGSFGFAKVYVRTGTNWAEQAELTAQEGAIADQFGHSVAIYGDTAVVGVPFKDVGGASGRGAVFVFKRSGSIWQQEAQLTASDGAAGHQFGYSVAIEGDTLVVGTPQPLSGPGAAYVFTRSGTSWTQRTKIIAAGGQTVDLFGHSVSLGDNTLVIGSPLDDNEAIGGSNNGSAYVLTGSGATWTLQAHLRAIEEANGDQFGNHVDINGDTIAVGARFVANGASTLQGAVYVFTRSGTTWTQQARLRASDGAASDQFGQSVSLSGDTLAVGSPFHNIAANSDQGTVYLFNRSGSTWTEAQILTANDGASSDMFGISVALQSNALLVGASGDDFASTNAQGSAYVFIPFGSAWTQVQKLFALDGATNDGYGNAVALNDRTLLIGASGDDFGSTADQGSAFVLVPGGPSVWTGANSANWSNDGNWDSSVAPNVFDDVLLPASGVTNEAVLNINANIHSLTIEAGRSLTINAGRTLTVNGDLTLNGTIVGGGTIVFNGTNFTNNNSINNVNVQFGAGTKLVYGGGLYFGNTVTALSGSTLTPFSSLTMTRFAIDNGGSLHIIGGYTLSLIGSGVVFTNNGGSVVGAGRISFDGTSPQFTSGAVVFSDLTINNAAGVTLGTDATVNQTLALTSGDLNTGAFTLNMPSAATSTGTTDVIGNVRRTGLTTATTLSFGNPNNQITFTSGTPPTDITVNLVKQTPSDFTNATRRTYTITPNGGSGFAATLRLTYQASELNGNTESTLGLWRKGASWANLGATTRNATDNWVELAGIAQFSPWVISGPAGPTAIEFAWATATQFDDRTLIEWQTGFEVSNLGFNLYRDENGRRTLVNPQLIAGSALITGLDTSLTAGRSYAWIDKSAQGDGATYWLEDVDTHGQSTWHGPVYVVQSSDHLFEHKIEQAKLLSALGNQQLAQGYSQFTPLERVASLPRARTASLSLQRTIAAAQAVKIGITQEGWYRVTYEELLDAGLAKDANPRNLRLIVDGEEKPMLVAGKESGSFDSFEAIEFYGVGTDSPYSNVHTYWLVASDQPGRRIPLIITKPDAQGAESFPFTIERKERNVYFSGLLNGDAENWFGGVVASNGINQPLTIRSLDYAAKDKAELEVALQGVTSLAANPDHQVEVRVNNQFIGELLFDGRDRKVERFAVPLVTLADGGNLVTLTARDGTDVSVVDRIRLTYPHKYAADDNSLKLTTSAASTSQAISDFTTDDIRVFDVTDSAHVRELAGAIEASTKTIFSIAVDTLMPGRVLLAITKDKFKKPDSISVDHPSALKQQNAGADFLIIARRAWMDALEPLRALREKQGLATIMVDVEDIFDEFSFGQKTPYAVRDFLTYASGNWRRKPRWVLFAGDASFDTRNYTGLGETDFVPTKLLDTAFMETASDDWLADFNADAIPDFATGRLPIRSSQDAITMVNKLLNYDLALPLDEIVLFADLNDGFDFESASLRLNALLPSTLRVEQLFRSRNSDATTRANLLNAIYRGQALVNYAGHGSVTNWRGNMLTTEDARGLSNTDRLPLFVMMNCLNGLYQDPLNESLAEALMRNERGGAIAVWASSGMTFPDEQASINQQLYRTLFGKTGLTLGEHVRLAKLATSDADVRRSWILLGDPTLRVKQR